MQPINTSLLELFKVGPGPSSSHTIGPMRAGRDFLEALRGLPRETLDRAARMEVRLYGSLAATGREHGTDRAVLAGLLGQRPETCTSEFLSGLSLAPDAAHALDLGGRNLPLTPRDIVADLTDHGFSHSNTLVLRLLDGSGKELFDREYASVGGGFITWRGQPEEQRGAPVFPFFDMRSLRLALAESSLPLHELLLVNETALTGRQPEAVLAELDRILEVMDQAVERGLTARGTLPGRLKLSRKAPILHERASATGREGGRFLLSLNAYAFAASEENAAGSVVATAPTSGSSGVIPAVARIMCRHLNLSREALRHGLIAAGAVGLLARHNASIAGAEVGCQGEIGVASSMAAAMLAYGSGLPLWAVETAAEIALEHHLGLTCDPVGGYVQIPCIERNAMGAVKAYNAFLIASVEDPGLNLMGLDGVIRAMLETGRDMSAKYKETSTGGLALNSTAC